MKRGNAWWGVVLALLMLGACDPNPAEPPSGAPAGDDLSVAGAGPGDLGRLEPGDLGQPDLAVCQPGTADCNGDPRDGCETRIDGDEKNCGGCGMACGLVANGSPWCAQGTCRAWCPGPFSDCDNLYVNGCEVDTGADRTNCGGCGTTCALPNAMDTCAMGACTVVGCQGTYSDCNMVARDGCEVDTSRDVDHCGACGQACKVAPNMVTTCAMGKCGQPTCRVGFADCNKDLADGCEMALQKDVNNCGACGKACPAKQFCVAGACTTCAPGALGFGVKTLQSLESVFMPVQLAMSDLNGDGKADIVIVNAGNLWNVQFPDSLSVFLGNGDGTFQRHVNYDSGERYPAAVAIADLNRDGKPDLVVVAWSFGLLGSVSVLLGKGDGTFKPAVLYVGGEQPIRISPGTLEIADLNGDGKLDLAFTADKVYVILGNGDGTLNPPVKYDAGTPLWGMAIGDLNGDGKPDLVTAATDGVFMLMGKGDGTFQPAKDAGAGKSNTQVRLLDMNRDGKADLVVINDQMRVLLGKGDGTFQAPVSYAVTGYVVGGDLDGDGKPDLIVTNQFVWALLGNGDGTLQAATRYGAGGYSGAVIGDLDGDGKKDVAVTNLYFPSTEVLWSVGNLSTLVGKGDGTLREPVSHGTMTLGNAIASGDLNGDGKADFLLASSGVDLGGPRLPGGMAEYLGNGDGTFQKAWSGGGTSPASVAIGDANGDGSADFVFADLGDLGKDLYQEQGIALGKGDGTFPSGIRLTEIHASSVAMGDLDGDGKADVVISNYESGFGTKGLTTWTSKRGVAGAPAQSGWTHSMAIGDLNGDGKGDLVTAADDGVYIFLGNGDATFQMATRVGGVNSAVSVVIGDLNGDGRPDLAVGGDKAMVLLGRGDGTFAAPASYAPGGAVSISDLDGDGIPDIAVASTKLNVLLGKGDGTFQPATPFGPTGPWNALTIAEVSSDCRPDIIATGDTGTLILINTTH